MIKTKGESRILWIELLRIFAFLAVIVIHVTSPHYIYSPTWSWRVMNFYMTSARFTVLFFFHNGVDSSFSLWVFSL